MKASPLGVFDSGFGGLTVLRSINRRLPELSTIYIGDNARAPYGTRSHDDIFTCTLQGVRFLFDRGCPLVILACNSASAQALRRIQQEILPHEYPNRRVLGVIRPAVEEVAHLSRSGHIGILATPATVSSNAYVNEFTALNSLLPEPVEGRAEAPRRRVEGRPLKPQNTPLRQAQGINFFISQIPCPGLVELIEAGQEQSLQANTLAQQYLSALLSKDSLIDTILLACTHYPLMLDVFLRHTPATISLIPQGDIVATKLATYLQHHPETNSQLSKIVTRTFLTTKSDVSSLIASRFYGNPLTLQTINL